MTQIDASTITFPVRDGRQRNVPFLLPDEPQPPVVTEWRVTCTPRNDSGTPIPVDGPTWEVASYEEALAEVDKYLGNGLNDDQMFIIEGRDVPAWTVREVHSAPSNTKV